MIAEFAVGARRYGRVAVHLPARFPFVLRILAENVLRHAGRNGLTHADAERLAAWTPAHRDVIDVPFHPGRVLMQDYTGIPSLVDLAALRDAMAESGGDPARVAPRIPVDLVIDHSLIVDVAGRPTALRENLALEFRRNAERYGLAKWAERAFATMRVVPPGQGILHQVNLERLATVVAVERRDGIDLACPDTLVGTDSHTTMVNGLGVLGWGVGGIEAEAAMLGLPLSLPLGQVVGVRLVGTLPEGATTTDLALTLAQRLRAVGVVDALLEFTGPALDHLGVADRATLANMAPEYGCTCAFFPIDGRTLDYLRLTGRAPDHVALVEAYAKAQGLWRAAGAEEPVYSRLVELDLAMVEPCAAGPRKPHGRVPLAAVRANFDREMGVESTAAGERPGHGAVVIAAITSCTNTSNPAVMVAAGLVARNAVRRGLAVKPWVKASLTPGSRAVGAYLATSGLQADLDALGFHVAGYGCGTCGGNSGPLAPEVEAEIRERSLVACAVLSGNRNFEARIHPLARGNYLVSPPLVVAYALAGTVGVDLTREPLGRTPAGEPVHLRDLWPSNAEIEAAVLAAVGPECFTRSQDGLFEGGPEWASLPAPDGARFAWDPESTYIRRPPWVEHVAAEAPPVADVVGARPLLLLGDGITTDHISPVGSIAAESPAALHLAGCGVAPRDFNAYGSRRANHEVMVRGTFANIRLRNEMARGREGGWTRLEPGGEIVTVHEAAQRHARDGVPLVVIAGRDYGAGSSRDWAAKGTALLGVRAVIAGSFERIHRANLVSLGVLPLAFPEGVTWRSLGLDGTERIDLADLERVARPRGVVPAIFRRPGVPDFVVPLACRLETESEREVWSSGGMLPHVLRRLRAA